MVVLLLPLLPRHTTTATTTATTTITTTTTPPPPPLLLLPLLLLPLLLLPLPVLLPLPLLLLLLPLLVLSSACCCCCCCCCGHHHHHHHHHNYHCRHHCRAARFVNDPLLLWPKVPSSSALQNGCTVLNGILDTDTATTAAASTDDGLSQNLRSADSIPSLHVGDGQILSTTLMMTTPGMSIRVCCLSPIRIFYLGIVDLCSSCGLGQQFPYSIIHQGSHGQLLQLTGAEQPGAATGHGSEVLGSSFEIQ